MKRVFLLLVVAAASAMPAGDLSAQRTHVLIASGLSGEPAFAQRWSAWADTLTAGLVAHGVRPDDIARLGEGPRASARATKAAIGERVTRLARVSSPGERVLLVLFGHGADANGEARINLSGPDLSAPELGALLRLLDGRDVIVVNSASGSGGFLEPLAGGARVVITATRSIGERNETLFGGHFAAAFSGAADTDKDGAVSLLEAFEYARLEVERSYESTNRIRTEHAMLAAADAEPTAEPTANAGAGAVAARIRFSGAGRAAATGVSAPVDASPELRALYERRARIQSELDALRARSGSMETSEYERALEALLVDLATVSQEIRRREGGGP